MNQRTKRGTIKTAQVLEKLERGRAGAIQVHREAKINSDAYRAARQILEAIDDLAHVLTGDKTHFHLKASTPDFGE